MSIGSLGSNCLLDLVLQDDDNAVGTCFALFRWPSTDSTSMILSMFSFRESRTPFRIRQTADSEKKLLTTTHHLTLSTLQSLIPRSLFQLSERPSCKIFFPFSMLGIHHSHHTLFGRGIAQHIGCCGSVLCDRATMSSSSDKVEQILRCRLPQLDNSVTYGVGIHIRYSSATISLAQVMYRRKKCQR